MSILKSKQPEPPTLDVERARILLTFLREHPEKHEQDIWLNAYAGGRIGEVRETCGTRGCVAGWAVLLFGPEDKELRDPSHNVTNLRVGRWSIPGLARELLGLTHEQADHLFYVRNTTDDIELQARRVLAYLIEHPTATGDELSERFG